MFSELLEVHRQFRVIHHGKHFSTYTHGKINGIMNLVCLNWCYCRYTLKLCQKIHIPSPLYWERSLGISLILLHAMSDRLSSSHLTEFVPPYQSIYTTNQIKNMPSQSDRVRIR
ncbi:hypothetical protein D3C74_399910 [compost metagenome]